MSKLVQILEGLPIEEELPILGPQTSRLGAGLRDDAEIKAFIARNGSASAYDRFGLGAFQALAASAPPQVAEIIARIQDQLRQMKSGVDVGSDPGLQKEFASLDAWL